MLMKQQYRFVGSNALYFSDYVLAIQYFNQIIKAKPYLEEPYLYRAFAKIMLEDYYGALSDINTVISKNEFIPRAYYARGYIYIVKDNKVISTGYNGFVSGTETVGATHH